MIDFLRGFALFTIIFIHSLVPYLSQADIHRWWNGAQYAVQMFVFCAAYIYFSHEITKKEKPVEYIVRRLKRLLIPYFIFLISFLAILLLTQPKMVTASYILASLFLLGGVDVNWLVVLFIELTVVFLFIKSLKTSGQLFFYVLAALSSLMLLFVHLPVNYKLIMWLPWSVVIFYAQQVVKNERNNRFHFLSLLLGMVLFAVSFVTLTILGRSTVFFDNKYPPNLFYLSYGIIWIAAVYLLQPVLLPMMNKLKRPILFLSSRSYTLFFIHTAVIYIFNTYYLPLRMYPLSFFLSVFLTSVCIQLALDGILKKFDTIRV